MRRALAFLTPFGGAAAPDQATLSWFPAAGALIGAAVGTAWWLAARVWEAPLAAAIAVAMDLALTGLLHIDGLIDAADGLLPHLSRERRLDVMAEPTVGAYGIAVGGAVLLLRYAALATTTAHVGLIAALWCASRTAMAVTTRALPYARAEGLASSMRGKQWGGVAAVGTCGAIALGASVGWRAEFAVAACLAGAAAVVGFGYRKLGGFTGDVVGAAGVAGETLALLVSAAKR